MREKKLLKSLNQLDDDLLLETEQAMETRRVWQLGRRAALLAAAVFLLALSVSAAYLASHWDQVFLNRFAPSEAVLMETKEAIQEVSTVSQCGDVTLGIHQSLGNETSLYLTLQVRLPDSVDLTPYSVPNPETGEMQNCCVLPENIRVYTKPVRYEQISGMSFEEAEEFLGEDGHSGDMISIETGSVDLETNTLTYLVSLSTEAEPGYQGDLAILVGEIAAHTEDRDNILAEGPYVISWKMNNQSDVYCFDLMEKGSKVGYARLSAFGLQVHLERSEYENCESLMQKVLICYIDGREEAPQGTCGASITLPGGAVDLTWQFDEIQLLDGIREIRIDEFSCALPDC